MLHWIVIFLGIALVAGLLGFRGIASTAFGIAEILIFIVVALIVIGVVVLLATGVV
ncbi:MAG TPA: DUF1328 domain-containing protein [Stellaceae bacterium]